MLRIDFKISAVFCIILLLVSTTALGQDGNQEFLTEIAAQLELDEAQTQQFAQAVAGYQSRLDALFAAQEGEEADPAALIDGVKAEQAAFEKELSGFMSKKQVQAFNDMKEDAIKGMLSDLAQIQLMDAQPNTSLTDEQIEQLGPVLADGMFGMMQVAWKYAGQQLRPRQKISVAKTLKGIQRDVNRGLESVLSAEQLAKWEAHKAEKSAQ